MAGPTFILSIWILVDGALGPEDATGAAAHTVGPISKMGTLSTSIRTRAIACGSTLHGLALQVAGEAFSLMGKLTRLPIQKVAVGHTDTSSAVVSTGEALTRTWAPASSRGAQGITHFALGHTVSAGPIMLDV